MRIIDVGGGDERVKIFEIKETPNDIRVVQMVCREYLENSGGCTPFPEWGEISILMPANGQLEGVIFRHLSSYLNL